MNNTEVERLRRLRASALRVRAVARALATSPLLSPVPLLARGQYAAWRVARVVSGQLRAHPYTNYQKDPGVAVVLRNGLTAASVALTSRRRGQGLRKFESHLRRLARQVDDARALTWASDLSDLLGRSQSEIRAVLAHLADASRADAKRVDAPRAESIRGTEAGAMCAPLVAKSADYSAPSATDWPYLAF